MKSNINYIINNIKNIEKKDLIFTNKYNSKPKLNKLFYYRNNSSNDNAYLWKTNYNINENSKNKKYINSNNNNSIEKNKIRQKIKLKRTNHSASLIRNNKNNDIQNSPKKLLENNKFNNIKIKKFQEIISLIKKKLDFLRNFNRENDNFFLDNNNNFKINLNSSKNSINIRNNKKRNSFNISRTIYKFKNNHIFDSYKENININNIEKKNKIKNKNDLTPYPYKRLQKKIRKYFSLSKSIKYPEKQFPFSHSPKEKIIKNDSPICQKPYNDKSNYIYKNKKIIYCKKKNHDIYRNIEIVKKEDKSINTDNTLVSKNNNDLNINENGNIKKDYTLFNNKIISAMTNNKEIKFFITNSNKKKL